MKNESKLLMLLKRVTKKTRRLDILLSLAVVVLLFSIPILLQQIFGISKDSLGVYGDFFGSVNALVSALAFAGLILSLHFQRQDLKMQREELRLTREEMKKQAEAQEKAAAEQAKQAELLAEQINKDIRPYINTYWKNPNYDTSLVIKNVGKSTCFDFSINAHFENDGTDLSVMNGFLTRLNLFKMDVFPSMIEYEIPLESYWFDRAGASSEENVDLQEKIRILIDSHTKLVVKYSFRFNDKIESFELIYDFLNLQFPVEQRKGSLSDIVREIQNLGRKIESLSSSVKAEKIVLKK
ncbi:MAG: hypothetical protein MJZ22_02315 [Candidatus Saccharibacteria bacterium]|nr:hypothetical protein [Candidatus Saccharibacteria bacterium]